MAENKKSFLIYTDWVHPIEKLDDEMAGKLFKHLMRFVNDKNPVSDELMVEVLFEAWKPQLERDLEKWKAMVKRNTKNASKKTNGSESLPLGRDIDIDIDIDKVKDSLILENRKTEFGKLLKSFKKDFPQKEREKFFNYWTEHNPNGKKMRFEMAKNQPFNMGRRIGTWKSNNNNNGQSGKNSKGVTGTNTDRKDFK